MWDNAQDEFEREVEVLQRQRPTRRLTRYQRYLDVVEHQEQLRQRDREQTAEMATARSPDNNPLDNAQDSPPTREGSWLSERAEVTGEVLGRSREDELRGAAVNVVEAVRGTPLPVADSTRHLNSPVSGRLQDVINRRNAARELWDAAERAPPQDQWGGARPRTQRPTAFGRGGHMSRSENRLVTSPERAFNLNDDHGRFLAQRLERQARLEAEAGDNRGEVRDLQRRYDEDRAGWRRREDEMAARIVQMQRQLDALTLQQQQQQPQQQPQQVPSRPTQ